MNDPKQGSLLDAQEYKIAHLLPSFDRDDLDAVRASLRNDERINYRKFCRSLTPHYGKIYIDIAIGYALLILVLFAIASMSTSTAKTLSVIIGSVLVGFLIAYLQLFIHEAAHFNIAANRRSNDLLANILLSWQVGTTVSHYRKTHSEHHAYLGEIGDTETTYRNKLSLSFMLQLLLGIYAIRIYLGRRRTAQSVSATYDGSQKKNDLMPLAAGATVHLAILFSLITIGAPYAAISWVIGMGMFFPFFAAIRQLLEHRPADNVPDGSATTRLFSDGLLAHFFGGAGFNRHLLHHLEPQISYTRLAEFEQFLSGTELKAWLDARRTTYSVAFCLLRKHLRHA